jgi:hypothetical protein
MLRIGTRTKLSPEATIERAIAFFGPDGGLGLKVNDRTADSVCFTDVNGGVDVYACAEEDGTSVDLVSREWDGQVKEFIGKIR